MERADIAEAQPAVGRRTMWRAGKGCQTVSMMDDPRRGKAALDESPAQECAGCDEPVYVSGEALGGLKVEVLLRIDRSRLRMSEDSLGQ